MSLICLFLIIDLVFLGANLMKVLDGGYVPLLIAMAIATIMWTWLRGTNLLKAKIARSRSRSAT